MNKNLFIIRVKAYTTCICLLLLTGIACKKEQTYIEPISLSGEIEKIFNSELSICINTLDSITNSKNIKKEIDLYKKARMHFKLAEPILSYVDQNNYKSLNAPNILQVSEDDPTDIKIKKPFGFQVIEELLHEPTIDSLKLKEIITITSSRLKLVRKNTRINLRDYHIIWLLRHQIVRIATTGITGFDSPVLGQSLLESNYTYQTLEEIIKLTETKFKSKALYSDFLNSISKARQALNNDFDSFDRFSFIKNHIHLQLELLVNTQKDWNVKFPFELALSNELTSLFSEKTLNSNFFSDYKSDTTNLKQKIDLGKKLFKDKNLSKSNNMACATCHIKEKGFTDGRVTFNNKQTRNTPTLTYATYQQLYFMDARAGSLEGQIIGVVNNHDEFNMSMDSIIFRVKKNKEYKHMLDSLYNNGRDNFNIRHAISSYVRTLNPFNSKFDNNINNKEATLTAQEKRGFNLFMGKAACATCHFPPTFNGTVPPNFTDTELEIIGIPKTNSNKELSHDLGRQHIFNTTERKGAFKTPTIRNIEKTAPYMHNGAYNSLEEVLDFYDKGGGAGLGFNLPLQTLPFDNLNLSDDEIKAIIAFMKTLNDNY
ncbi:methylamine utilization protein [Flavivirga aquatica]|uniref:Methylamine utilization protein n=1 Tax=Flavivirga aquatica TaxID=1849968 RepID=A0A1E5T8L1_9FLAO|nr:cytochrome c peroxidase [Flavivirga aquatica]OEK07725.1 methylamine utilization protein [Flavivirga aquatica]